MNEFELARQEIMALQARPGLRDALLHEVCAILQRRIAHYDWVGFYIALPQERMLVLGPYVGAPTEHTRIPYGRGICGQVAQSEQPLAIPDVREQSNYLSCSVHVRSEIVLPVMKEGQFVAQLDIDSHQVDPFGPEDTELLEAVCQAVAALF